MADNLNYSSNGVNVVFASINKGANVEVNRDINLNCSVITLLVPCTLNSPLNKPHEQRFFDKPICSDAIYIALEALISFPKSGFIFKCSHTNLVILSREQEVHRNIRYPYSQSTEIIPHLL